MLLMLCRSLFLSLLPRVPWSISTITNVFYIWVCAWSCLFLCMCLSHGSIFHEWEKTCGLCLSEPGLLHLIWCPPIASIYFPTTCHYSLWLSKTLLCVYTNFLDPFISCSYSPFFNSFQYISLYLLSSQMLCIMILLILYHSFFIPPSPSFTV
jgi:hypothetical protein